MDGYYIRGWQSNYVLSLPGVFYSIGLVYSSLPITPFKRETSAFLVWNYMFRATKMYKR